MDLSNENDYLNCSATTAVDETKQHKPSSYSYRTSEQREDLSDSEASYILGYN